MTVADDLRAVKRQRQFHSARDFETSASQIGEVDPVTEDTKRKAQIIIAGYSVGETLADRVDDAATLMRMLGVHPDDDFDPDAPVVGPPPHPTNTR